MHQVRHARRSRGWGILAPGSIAVVLALAASTACSSDVSSDPPSEAADTPVEVLASVHVPVQDTVVVPSSTAAGLAVATSSALYEHSPIAVLAAEGDLAGQARAASVAVGLGAPLLLAPSLQG